MAVIPGTAPTYNIEFYAYKLKFEDGSIPPLSYFTELIAADMITTWDHDAPRAGSIIKNIMSKSLGNDEGTTLMLGVLVEATTIDGSIEIMDITGKIEEAELKKIGVEDSEEFDVKDDTDTSKLMFTFKRWRIGILPDKGVVVIERKSSGYEKKLEDFFNSWTTKWIKKDNSTRKYQAMIIDPYLTGETPSEYLAKGNVGSLEFSLSSDILSKDKSFFDSDLKKMFEKDQNLVVTIEVKAKRGQHFRPDMTSAFIELIKAHEDNIQKCSGKTVSNNRKSKPINLINSLKHKVCTLKENTDADVLNCVKVYLKELDEDAG